jgi:hypothetical protein
MSDQLCWIGLSFSGYFAALVVVLIFDMRFMISTCCCVVLNIIVECESIGFSFDRITGSKLCSWGCDSARRAALQQGRLPTGHLHVVCQAHDIVFMMDACEYMYLYVSSGVHSCSDDIYCFDMQ